uniref:DWNN domain-containing protein n=2 Tax=Amphiprion TaxID=80969 RepID=A0AAQ5YMH7_AMPOC
MPHIHYKFSSKLSYDTVVFDGPHVTLEELKRRIMGREKLRAADCDLQITNAQSKEEFTDDNSLIHKGSSVIVRRIPISGVKPSPSSKTHNIEQSDVQHHHAFGASRAVCSQPKSHSTSPTAPQNTHIFNTVLRKISECTFKISCCISQQRNKTQNTCKKWCCPT